jgi:hypothetical protein
MEIGRMKAWLRGMAWLVAACAPSGAASQETASAQLVEETKAVALGLQQRIAGRLKEELERGGPEGAIAVCANIAQASAARVSRERGWRVSRVSLRARNALIGDPDPWEQRALLDFTARAARGEDASAMEFHEIVNEPAGRYLRYMKALPVVPLCMNCHGPAETLNPGVREALAREYPNDRATGFAVGMIRGGLTVKRPLPPAR